MSIDQQLKIWFSPDESLEAVEILAETADRLRNTAEFASMRKELRLELQNAASRIQDFVAGTGQGIIDASLIAAMDGLAKQNGTTFWAEATQALERHITIHNRKKA